MLRKMAMYLKKVYLVTFHSGTGTQIFFNFFCRRPSKLTTNQQSPVDADTTLNPSHAGFAGSGAEFVETGALQ